MSTMKDMKNLLDQANADSMARYSDEWQAKAVAFLNEYYLNHDRYDDEIYDAEGELWEEVVKHNLEKRGVRGLLFLLGKVEPADDLIDRLEWAIDELENEEED